MPSYATATNKPLPYVTDHQLLASAAVRAVYAYEVGIRALRERMAAFAARAVELSEERTARWQGIDEGLAVLRMAVLVVLVLALARLLQRRVVAPLAELSAAARAVCSGDFASRVSETGGDEVGDLQRAFNAMGTRLRGYDDDSRRSQHELSEALERSEAANRSKSDFVASISHELRTPMHGVIGMAELLLREDIDDEVRERVDAIHTSASGLLAVINDILDFSRLEADRTRLRSEPLDLRELVSECIALLSSRACERAVELRMEIDAGVPMWVLGDADRLRQVLNNLVGNAVKFTEEGRVTVRVCRAEGADGRLQVAIEDTGVGIAADALERIFEPFVQADGSIQRRHGGTGLGLAISRRLVDAMGGRIAVRSVPGSGTEFSFEIALEPCAPPSDDTVADPKLAQIGAHLLIAEDHPVNQALARRMMTKLGCTFEIAADGKEAVAAFERSRFDLVLMDCHMPEMDGYHATRAIRELEAGTASRIPIVAMTAGAMDSDRAAARDAGMDDFLTKPFSLGDLQRLLERWVRRSERG